MRGSYSVDTFQCLPQKRSPKNRLIWFRDTEVFPSDFENGNYVTQCLRSNYYGTSSILYSGFLYTKFLYYLFDCKLQLSASPSTGKWVSALTSSFLNFIFDSRYSSHSTLRWIRWILPVACCRISLGMYVFPISINFERNHFNGQILIVYYYYPVAYFISLALLFSTKIGSASQLNTFKFSVIRYSNNIVTLALV